MRACTRVGSLSATMERWSVLVVVMGALPWMGSSFDGLDESHGAVGDWLFGSIDFSFLVRGRTCVVVERAVGWAERVVMVFEPASLVFEPGAMVCEPAAMVFEPAAMVFEPAAMVFEPAAMVFEPA